MARRRAKPSAVRPEPSAEARAASADGPPQARRDDVVDTLFGVKVADPYRWLEDGRSEETRHWLTSFDGYTRKVLASLPGRQQLAARLTELSYVEWVSPPRRRGQRYFWRQQHKDKEKAIWYWREGKTGKPQVLIDPNALSPDGSIALHGVFPSYDGKWLAYKLAKNNSDEATLYLMDVASGKNAKDEIAGAKYAEPSWDPKGTGFYYTRLPTDGRVSIDELPGEAAVYFHKLGDDPQQDALVREKTGDPKTFIAAEVSRDGHYLVLGVYHGWTSNDLYYKDLRKHKEWQPLVVGENAHFYETVWKDRIYVRTDDHAPHYRLMEIDPARGVARSHWRELIAEDKKAVLESAEVVGDHLALKYLRDASSLLSIADLRGKVVRTIETPSIGTLSELVGNPEDDEAYYSYESFLDPLNVYETSIQNGGRRPFFEIKVPVDPSPYLAEQVWYRSKDGTPISMFVVRRKDMKKDGTTPFLLTGYGGFKISKVPVFTATLFAWLEKGGGYALPNLRGGGEYGEDWHRAGMRDNKQNVFDDFIGAAEWLTQNGYTTPKRLAISGGSNGGLLVGATMTERPDLFGAVVCAVPLLDMVRYHRFGSGRTWISEYGSAEDPAQFKTLYAYSPYHHVRDGTAYPALLMLTADSDDRVDPLHARKFAAAVEHAEGGKGVVLVRVETHAGHGGGDMIKKNVERNTDMYAFLFDALGMNHPATH